MDQPARMLVSEIILRLKALGVPVAVQSAIVGLVEHSADSAAVRCIRLRDTNQVAISTGDLARRFLKASLFRSDLLSRKLMGSGGPNMLLDLISAEEEDRAVTVSSLCHASGEAQTTALRLIDRMVEQRLVTRSPDPRDHRRIIVKPTRETTETMSRLINSCRVPADRTDGWITDAPSLD